MLGDNLIWKFFVFLEIIVGFLPRCCQNSIQKLEKNLNDKINLMGTNAGKKWGRLARQNFNPNLVVTSLNTKNELQIDDKLCLLTYLI